MDQIFVGENSLVSADESIAEGEVALPQLSDFILQAQKSLNFEPSGVRKTIELDASHLERHSALYNLEHSSDLLLEHIFSHSPPIIQQLEKKTEIDRQPLANLFKKKSRHHSSSKSKRNTYYPSKMLKKLGLERLTIFQPRSGRDDLDQTSPAIAPQDDPRSPNPSTLNRVFLSFSSLKPSETPVKIQSSESVSKPEVPSQDKTQIGLGLPSPVVLRRRLRQQEMSQGIDAVRCWSRRSNSDSSQEYPSYSFIVTEPSFGSSYNNNRVQSVVVESSNRFLKPSQFTERSLYDIVEVPTPPSSTMSSPRGTPSSSSSPRNQWSSPFIRLNPPQKRKSFRPQTSSTPSTGSPTNNVDAAEIAVNNDNVDPLLSAEVLRAPPAVTGAHSGFKFKRYVSKLRDIFKRSSRSVKTSDSVLISPVLIEHPDAELLRQDDNHYHHQSGANENGLTSSISTRNLQLLF